MPRKNRCPRLAVPKSGSRKLNERRVGSTELEAAQKNYFYLVRRTEIRGRGSIWRDIGNAMQSDVQKFRLRVAPQGISYIQTH
jgi:hypothetical protein